MRIADFLFALSLVSASVLVLPQGLPVRPNPPPAHANPFAKMSFDRILRYQTMINRQLYQAINQLERLQRLRKGDQVPALLNLQVLRDTPMISEEENPEQQARSANYETKPRSLLFSGESFFGDASWAETLSEPEGLRWSNGHEPVGAREWFPLSCRAPTGGVRGRE
jgi:hypothetical protein